MMAEERQIGPARLRRVAGVRNVQLAIALVVVAALPAGAVGVFTFDADRGVTADVVGVVFFGAIVLLLITPRLPLPSQRGRPVVDRVQSMCFLWFAVTFTTHVTWELLWLVLHDRIVSSPDAPWAYPWWMYIDGGDARYATAGALLITQEALSVLNGIVGFAGLGLWWQSRGRSPVAVALLMSTAVVHLYSTAVYFGSEALDGYPNVDTSSIPDFWIKFWLLNGLWLIIPWFVIWWGWQRIGSCFNPGAEKRGEIAEGLTRKDASPC